MIALLAFACPLALYLRWPSCFWNFDGVACAAALELGNPVYFFHSNHLLYGFLGFLFWKIIAAPLGITRALTALQLFTPLLSALALISLYRVLATILDGKRVLAVLLSTAMGVTAVVWVWSVEAQVYALGFLGLSTATYVMLARPSTTRYRWVGLWHAFAILGHLMHVLWVIPAGLWIWSEATVPKSDRPSHLRQYLLWMTGTSVAAYALVYAVVLRPAHLTSIAMSNWLKGSVGLSSDRHWAWHHDQGFAPFHWLHSTAGFFWGTFWPYTSHDVSPLLWGLTAVSMALVIGLLACSFRSNASSLRGFAWSWIAVYGLFLWSWEPVTLCYRMTEAIPFGMLLALGVQTIKNRTLGTALVAAMLGSLMVITWTTRIKPMSDSNLNVPYQEMMALTQDTPPTSFYLTRGGLPWMYLLYFSGRKAWDIDHVPADRMASEMKWRRHAAPIYIRSDAFDEGKSIPWIVLEQWTPVENLPWRRMRS